MRLDRIPSIKRGVAVLVGIEGAWYWNYATQELCWVEEPGDVPRVPSFFRAMYVTHLSEKQNNRDGVVNKVAKLEYDRTRGKLE